MSDPQTGRLTGESMETDLEVQFPGEVHGILAVPLLAQAKARLGKPVVIYIPGGIRIDGDLTDVDDTDLTLTIVDGSRQYDIALASVAVIEGKR